MKLTQVQEIAAKTTGRNIIVSAGAGTGKTRVLVERFLNLITSGEASVTEILTLTFTEKAANEMKSRILQRLGELGLESERRNLESAFISTIHAFATRLLREHPLEAGMDPDFRVLEPEESDFLKEQALDEVFEEHCQKGNDIFDLVRVYGLGTIRAGIFRVIDTARHDGKYFQEFLEVEGLEKKMGNQAIIIETLEVLEEFELADEFRGFEKKKEWSWKEIESFKAWFKGFSRRGGKKHKADWLKIVEGCREALAEKVSVFERPWRQSFEQIALAFEDKYEAMKKEKSMVDFDDLQIKALRLFKREGRVYEKLRDRYKSQFRQIMVDEFQDTNQLQLEFIETFAGDSNVFFVGDFKQSIYGFRGAEPEVFLKKEKEYEESEEGIRLPLVENFRSRENVLSFANSFFSALWHEDEFQYENLVPFKHDDDEDTGAEVLLVNRRDEESLDHARMREARAIAQKISELHDEGTPYGDIAILFQAMTEIGIYEQALKSEGIPYYAVSGRGFYHQQEVKDMISFLSFLENPLSDIPLAASLRSPLFQVSNDALFWLSNTAKKTDKCIPLYKGIKAYEDIEELSDEDRHKIRFFLDLSEKLLAVKDRLKLTELLDRVMEGTSYELTVLADRQGIRRYANLKKMVSLAREFESHEPMALGDFLRTIKRLETQEVRESEAQIEAEESGKVVRLLSIHRSKGLEFPVVFVSDLGRARQSPESKTILSKSAMGFSMKVRNEETLQWECPLAWHRIDESNAKKDKEEWKRLFYVAVTRAGEKLFLTGVHKQKEKPKKSFYEMSSWMDWVMTQEIVERTNILINDVSEQGPKRKRKALAEIKGLRDFFDDLMPREIESLLGKENNLGLIREEGDQILEGLLEKPRKPSRVVDLSVSAYAAYKQSPEKYVHTYELGYPDSPEDENVKESAFMVEEDQTSAEFGTCIHSILERINFQKPDQDLDRLIEEGLGQQGAHRFEEAKDLIQGLIQSGLFRDLQQAKVIKRELPFVLNERHGIIYGVIDVLFQDREGDWHILDYKTAVGDEQKVQKAGYDTQLELYALAAQKILKKPLKSGILYFLRNQWHYVASFDSDRLEESAKRIREIQEEILDFRNQKIDSV